jgi:hypothetical protein
MLESSQQASMWAEVTTETVLLQAGTAVVGETLAAVGDLACAGSPAAPLLA